MTIKPNLPGVAFLRFAIIFLFILSGFVASYGQNQKPDSKVTNIEDGWWKPVLKKHKIDLNNFNFKYTFDMGMNDTVNILSLELGTSDSLNNRIVPMKNVIIISPGEDSTYWIESASRARHDLDNNLIFSTDGKDRSFNLNENDTVPILSFDFKKMKRDLYNNIMVIED